jgi:hypothetical protein
MRPPSPLSGKFWYYVVGVEVPVEVSEAITENPSVVASDFGLVHSNLAKYTALELLVDIRKEDLPVRRKC